MIEQRYCASSEQKYVNSCKIQFIFLCYVFKYEWDEFYEKIIVKENTVSGVT